FILRSCCVRSSSTTSPPSLSLLDALPILSATSTFAIDVPAAVLAEARRGSMPAFERLYRLFERPVYTLALRLLGDRDEAQEILQDRKSTRLNSSHVKISYAVFCLKKKTDT